MTTTTGALARLQTAINQHDLEALVGCFTDDYRSTTPVHPQRSFRSAAQVRANWTRIFAGVPDITARLVRSAECDGEVWAEWEWSGTRVDGTPHLMRGVTILGIDASGQIAWTNFYMELVEQGGMSNDAAVSAVAGAGATS